MGKRRAAPAGEEAGFWAAIRKAPGDATARAAYADWLDEHGRPVEAAEQRGAAGLSALGYKLRRKSDGLFSEGFLRWRTAVRWTARGKLWRRLSDLRSHLAAGRGRGQYGREAAQEDLEVVAVEVRAAVVATLPLSFPDPARVYGRDRVVVGDPVPANGPG